MDQKSFGGMEVVATDAETNPNVPSLAHPSNVIPFSKDLRTKNKTKQTNQTQKLEPPISDDSTSGPVFEKDNSLLRNENLNNRILFPVSSEKLVKFLIRKIEIETNLILDTLDQLISQKIAQKISSQAPLSKSTISENLLMRLVNSISATGSPGHDRTIESLKIITDNKLNEKQISEFAFLLRNEGEELRKAKSYIYNQKKCINSFLKLEFDKNNIFLSITNTKMFNSIDDLYAWKNKIVTMWEKLKIINSFKSISMYKNSFNNFIKNSIPDFTYGNFLTTELRKYLSIPEYERFLIELNSLSEMFWQENARCAEIDAEAFFPEHGGSTREAKKVCFSCQVQIECLLYALKNKERFGVWGGFSENERFKLSDEISSSELNLLSNSINFFDKSRQLRTFLENYKSSHIDTSKSRNREIDLIRVKNISDIQQIWNIFLKNEEVNFELPNNDDLIKRFIDILTGATFVNGGSIEKITNQNFRLTSKGKGSKLDGNMDLFNFMSNQKLS
jgi:WhiB family redox-sensing transcriptional regulator